MQVYKCPHFHAAVGSRFFPILKQRSKIIILPIGLFFPTKQVKTSVNVHVWSFWSNLQIIHCNTTERDGLNMKDYPVLYFMHYLHTLQWSQQLCWLPPQPWWGRFSVRREPPGPPESLSLTAGCRRAGSRFAALSTPPANYIKVNQWTKQENESGSETGIHLEWFIPDPFFHLLSSC